MARERKILVRANPFRGPMEGVSSENRDIFGPWNGNERSERHMGAKKSIIRAHPFPMALEMAGPKK